MKVELKFGRVLVKKSEVQTVSKGGIITPDVAMDKAQSGEVKASASQHFAVGDKVIFGKYSGIEMQGIAPELEDFLLFREEEIFAVIDGSKGTEITGVLVQIEA